MKTETTKTLPIPGEVFSVENHTAFLILPDQKNLSDNIPWVWYAPTLPNLPSDAETWMFEKFLSAGIAIAGIDVGESYGSPQGRNLYSALYNHLIHERNLSPKTCLLARSRGGLMLYNWAIDHPMSVACIAGIYPVCNLSSYPGLNKACGAYGLSEELLESQLSKHNPIDRLEPLSKANIPIFHIHGDDDQVVPLKQNSDKLAKRYQKLGGDMTLKVIENQGHNMWAGWFRCQELVDFITTHATQRTDSK